MKPPYKGVIAVMAGMTWARAAIFWGSDCGKDVLLARGVEYNLASTLPPLLISTGVQFVNQPIVRASITIQDPSTPYSNVRGALVGIYQKRGAMGLWHGTSAGVMKTVPKYCTAIYIKDFLEERLPRPEVADGAEPPRHLVLARSAVKSMVAGVAGAALTNPLDVVRNEMFKTDLSVGEVVRKLYREEGMGFCGRGIQKNMVAVAVPIAITIFSTDFLVRAKHEP